MMYEQPRPIAYVASQRVEVSRTLGDRGSTAYWYFIAGYCSRRQYCPEIIGPVLYYRLADWREENEAYFRASDDGMPEHAS